MIYVAFLLNLLIALFAFASAMDNEVCGTSCTKDAMICKGSCGVCMSENNVDYFCGSVMEKQLIEANCKYSNGTLESGNTCGLIVVGKNTLATYPRRIAEFLGLEDADKFTGHCFR